MAGRSPTIASGRRGYLIYRYGNHFWVPAGQAGWMRGIVRDTARIGIPAEAVYDSTDYLLHQVGVAQKRGGTSYAMSAMSASSFTPAVAYAEFPGGSQLVAIGSNSHLFTGSGATDKGATVATVDRPKLRLGGGSALLVIAASDGTTGPHKYDGTAAPGLLAASAPAGKYLEIYKTRVVIGGSTAQPQRNYFSPTPDITATWDTTNSWIDGTYATTGYALLNNALILFSAGHMERIIGSNPPPNSDMSLAPVGGGIGCTDARSIVTTGTFCYFANPRGVYVTNGTDPVCLTKRAGFESYWQSLFASYNPATWTISCGMYRTFLFITVLDGSRNIVASLMCDVNRESFWRITNTAAAMWATAFGVQDELYYADASTNRVVACSGMFSPSAANKNDANGNAVLPTIELAPFADGNGVSTFGFGHIEYDMRDAASDNPTMAVTLKAGIEADTTWSPPESPLAETTTALKARVQVNRQAQAVTVQLAQTGASAKTELYSVELMQRGQSLTGEGVS